MNFICGSRERSRSTHSVVQSGIDIRRHAAKVRFTQHLPVVESVLIAGLVPAAEFISETPRDVPSGDPVEVLGHFGARRVTQFSALFVIPDDLVGVVGNLHGGCQHPRGDRGEVGHHWPALGGGHEILHERIEKLEVPKGFGLGRRIQLRHRDAWMGEPRQKPHQIRTEFAQRLESLVVDGGGSPEWRSGPQMGRQRGARYAGDGLPVDPDWDCHAVPFERWDSPSAGKIAWSTIAAR